jgi:hypothetical protein
MAFGQKIIPLSGVNTDLHESLMPPNLARFIKNLVYEISDTATATAGKGSQTGVFKPSESNAKYIENLVLPQGYNQSMGCFSFRELRQVFCFIYNSEQNHTIYRLNGGSQTFDIVYQGPLLNFQLKPQYFIATGGCWLEQVFVTDPATGLERIRTYLMFTDGFNHQRFICVEDSIATQGFNAAVFPYFSGVYDREGLINMGVLTPSDCISISEVAVTPGTAAQNNRLLYNTWQFRLMWTDVWGRPSEHGIISNMYIPAGSDCISTASSLPNCLDLVFPAPPPYINSIQVEYRNCNNNQWYLSDVLDLYNGSPQGDWWLRERNSRVNYDQGSGQITYRFCADKECDPLPPAETDRLFNPLPRTSQSVAAIGNFMALANNEDGFLPFSQTLKDKITFTVNGPNDPVNTANNFRNISILVEIYNPYLLRNQPIFQQGIAAGQPNAYGFGAVITMYQYRAFFAFKQYFLNPAQQGFAGYLAGTNNFTISTQWVLRPNGSFTQVTNFSPQSIKDTGPNVRYFQKFVFSNVPAGKYIFRLASHQSDPSVDANYQKTSTTTAGTYSLNWFNFADPVNHNFLVNHAKELIVDVCTKDYDSIHDGSILVVWDLNYTAAMRAGYVTNKDSGETTPVELLQITGGDFNSYYTDHNGYYFASGKTDGSTGHGFAENTGGMCNCKYVNLFGQDSGYQWELRVNSVNLDQVSGCLDYPNQACQNILIKGKVALCGSGIGVPNVSVVLTRGSTAVTDADGNFTLIAHDDIRNKSRGDNLYFITSTCSFKGCDDGCIDPVFVTFNACVTCSARQVDVPTVMISYRTARGLLSGGTYPVGIVGWDRSDRPTFVQQDPSYYIKIPSVQETQIFAPSSVTVDIDPTAIFPEEVAYITPWIGPETTIADYITWIVDNVQFIDNTGNVNNTAPTQIKIFYASLIEYNKQNNYNTTVNWNFIAAGTNTPVISDTVQFLLNGDGTFFPKAISAIVKYDTTGQYFLINYTSDLAGLLPNAIIRLVRPKQCTGTEPYFEICTKIPIVDRKATLSSFVLNAFDTYYVNRQIPVPTLQPNSSPPVFINEPRTFGVPFETNSPSDFWGQGCHNMGRANSKNPYETTVYSPEQVALSGPLSPTGQLNYLNYFDDAKKKDFSDTLINGITALLPETSTILVLGQSDSFIVGFNDNLARVNNEGVVMAPSIENQFGQPERKVGSNYGCMLYDKNTIYKKEGIVQFLDTSKAVLVQHNYQQAIPVSNNGAEGLIRTKIKQVQAYNLVNTATPRYFVGIINPINHEYLLTDYIIGSNNFINSARNFDPTLQETLAFDVFGKAFKGTWSFTPEYYSELEGELNDQQLFSFINGIPYRHYTSLDSKTYNTFYGVKCERVMQVVIVMDNLKKKKPLAVAVYCKQGAYFADQVLTETGQASRILLPYFTEAEFGWYAPFLCDLNTPPDSNLPLQTGPNALLDGNMLTGTWIMIRLVGDPAVNDQYSELQGIATEIFPSEKSGAK